MKHHFEQFAAYNRWANSRLYGAVLELGEDDYRRDVGAFFKSLHGTLNHLVVADRIWMKRLTGNGEHPNLLDAIIHEDRRELTLARAEEDDRIVSFVNMLDADLIGGVLSYSTTSGKPHEQPRSEVLAHFFNHQTHHRGQAHTILSIVTGKEAPSLDLLSMHRGNAAPDLRGPGELMQPSINSLGLCWLALFAGD